MFKNQEQTEDFLANYWQQKPLLLPGALSHFTDPMTAEELAGLACEEEVESRLVFKEEQNWRLESGPFSEQRFQSLPAERWTLLVQGVDHWVPDIKALLKTLPFLPSWRLDDIMVSYATPEGGVGPHFDYYDVFLIQGRGRRRWQIGQPCDHNSLLRPDTDLKILQDFQCREEYELAAGDVLYIPPGVAHYGISLDDSLSYSIGFRAPSYGEILYDVAEVLGTAFTEDDRYTDPPLETKPQPGEINEAVLERLQDILKQAVAQKDLLGHWFGRYMTELKNPELQEVPDKPLRGEELKSLISAGKTLIRHPGSRFAYRRQAEAWVLFADGEAFPLSGSAPCHEHLVLLLSDTEATLSLAAFIDNQECLGLLCQLYDQGSLLEADNDD